MSVKKLLPETVSSSNKFVKEVAQAVFPSKAGSVHQNVLKFGGVKEF